jgi:hypothetical protein
MKHHTTPAGEQPATDPQPAAYNPPTPDPEVTVEATPDDELKPGDPAHARARAAAAHTTATWLGLHRAPPSFSDAWNMSSAIIRERIPGRSGLLTDAWWVLSWSERIAMTGMILVLLLPLSVLLYCLPRPTRRIALYAILLLVFVAVPAIAGG